MTEKDLSKHRVHVEKRYHGRPRATIVAAQINFEPPRVVPLVPVDFPGRVPKHKCLRLGRSGDERRQSAPLKDLIELLPIDR